MERLPYFLILAIIQEGTFFKAFLRIDVPPNTRKYTYGSVAAAYPKCSFNYSDRTLNFVPTASIFTIHSGIKLTHEVTPLWHLRNSLIWM